MNAEKILEIAKKEIGTKEYPANSNRQKYGAAYGCNGVAWCMQFVWWCFKTAEASDLFYGGGKTASCTALMKYAKANNQWVTKDYQPGDIILFNFDSCKTDADHTGICESATATTVTCIEGNTSDGGSQDNGGEVLRKTRKICLVLGAYRPNYVETIDIKKIQQIVKNTVENIKSIMEANCNVIVKILKKGSKGSAVRALQILLNGYGYNCGSADGDFGTKTETALKAFQKANGLTVDGIAGAKTWQKLID